jgi:hypothetical protein
VSVEARMRAVEQEIKAQGWRYTEAWHLDDGSTAITVYIPAAHYTNDVTLSRARADSKLEALIRAFREAKGKVQELSLYAEVVT